MSDWVVEVRQRARNVCEYCRAPQAGFRRSFHMEHIVARQHGGRTESGNLALACWTCNLRKGPNLAGIDSETADLVALFHPRRDRWPDHFDIRQSRSASDALDIVGLTPIGRATAKLLDFNGGIRPSLRHDHWLEGLLIWK